MSADFETRLWSQLEAAAERKAARARSERAWAAICSRWHLSRAVPGFAAALAALVLVTAVVLPLRDVTTSEISAPMRLRVIHVAEGLDRGVVAGGRVYLHDTSANALVRIDPASGSVAGRTPLHTQARNVSMAADGDAVWVVATPYMTHSAPERIDRPLPLARVDARTGQVTTRVALRSPDGEPFIPFGVIAGAGRVWVWGPAGALRIDPATGRPQGMIAVPGNTVIGFAASERDAWATTVLGRLLRFDAATGARIGSGPSEPLDAPFDLVVAPGALTMGDQHGAVIGLDPGTGHRLWHTPVGSALLAAAPIGHTIWAAVHDQEASHDALIALDSASGEIRSRVALPAAGVQAMIPVADTIWVVMRDGDVIIAGRKGAQLSPDGAPAAN